MKHGTHTTVTLINIFEVAAEHAEIFVAQWRERAVLMSKKPGSWILACIERSRPTFGSNL